MADVAGLAGQYVAFVFSAIMTAVAFYWSKKKADPDLEFDPKKFATTVVTAIILATVAFVLWLTGVLPAPDVAAVETYLATFMLAGPFSLFVQKLIQIIWRWYAAQG